MPQFRRKVPFSGKAKKEQLKLKKKATCSKGMCLIVAATDGWTAGRDCCDASQ